MRKAKYAAVLVLILAVCIAAGPCNETGYDEIRGDQMHAELLYMGQASIRIVTKEGKVIYIDPYAGTGYSLPADLILVTHGHYDHCDIGKVERRSSDCVIITHEEALAGGIHHTFELPYVRVEAVEAGNNRYHDVKKCVGYILTFSDGIQVYISGDTSATGQMEEFADRNIDYAFYCCDGLYNMGMEEAAQCAEKVKAAHDIPYHNDTSGTGSMFDENSARHFRSDHLLIIKPDEPVYLTGD